MARTPNLIAALAVVVLSTAAGAHHSFAAFFDPIKTVAVTGTVTSFAFTNPHGLIAIDVKAANGAIEHWRAETNAPVVLMRRGWQRDSIKPGEVITIDGWVARDGKPYLRLRKAMRADGSVIGVPFGQNDG